MLNHGECIDWLEAFKFLNGQVLNSYMTFPFRQVFFKFNNKEEGTGSFLNIEVCPLSVVIWVGLIGISSALQCNFFNFAWERKYPPVFNCIKSI